MQAIECEKRETTRVCSLLSLRAITLLNGEKKNAHERFSERETRFIHAVRNPFLRFSSIARGKLKISFLFFFFLAWEEDENEDAKKERRNKKGSN